MAVLTDSFGFTETLHGETPEYQEFYHAAVKALETSYPLLTDDHWHKKEGWKVETHSHDKSETVYSKSIPKIGKVFVLTSRLNLDLEAAFDHIYTKDEQCPTWNPTIAEYNDILGGLVKSREFVDTRCWRKIDGSYVLAATNANWSGAPKHKDSLRGETVIATMKLTPVKDHPGVTELTWLMCSELKGLLPKALVDRTFGFMMLEYTGNLKKHLKI